MKPAILLPAVLAALLLSGCAAYDGAGLRPGIATERDVVDLMGRPALRWRSADGASVLAYPRGPEGYQTYFATVAPDGKLASIANVLTEKRFALIKPGMSKTEVLDLIGPPYAPWTAYFKARDELVWEWRYCSVLNEASYFDVLFDASTNKVRSTQSRVQNCGRGECWCS